MIANLHQYFPEDLLPLLVSAKEELYLVGGAVRDFLLREETHDFDFVVRGDVRAIARRVADDLDGAFFMLDKERNTARVLSRTADGTSLRLDFAQMRGSTLEQDLQDRDFTINAMAVDLGANTIIDPCGGAVDLKNKRLKACSENSIPNDPVRILRAIRFATQFDLAIDPKLKTQIRRAAPTITNVSWERIRDELVNILNSSHSGKALRVLGALKVRERLFPELDQKTDPHAENERRWEKAISRIVKLDTLFNLIVGPREPGRGEHLAAGLVVLTLGPYRANLQKHYGECITPDRRIRYLLKLAALLWPLAQMFEKEKVREIIRNKGKQLALSGAEIHRLISIVEAWKAIGAFISDRSGLDLLTIYRFFNQAGPAGIDACLLSISAYWSENLHELEQDDWASLLQIYQKLFSSWWDEYARIIAPPQLIDGVELMNEFSLSPGPEIGQLIEAIREAQVEQGISTREEALQIARSWLEANKPL